MKNKFVGLREFQQKLHQNLPDIDENVVITRHGNPVYVVANVGTTADVAFDSTTNIQKSATELKVDGVREEVRAERLSKGFCMCHKCVEDDVESKIMWEELEKEVKKKI